MPASPPSKSPRRGWWAPTGGGDSTRVPPDRLDVAHHASTSLTTPVSASTSTSSAWASALHHSQRAQGETTPQRYRPPITPISPPVPRTSVQRRAHPEDDMTWPRQDYESRRPSREYEIGPRSAEYDTGRPSRVYEVERPREYESLRRRPPDVEIDEPPPSEHGPGRQEREYQLPPLRQVIRHSPRPHGRDELDDRASRGSERSDPDQARERRRDDLDDDERLSQSRGLVGSASPGPGTFNGWGHATLYYHAIHRLPPLSSWCSTVLEMALKSEQTWSVSRHANDLPPLSRVVVFYRSERGEVMSRAASEKGSSKGSQDVRRGSTPLAPSEGSRPDPDAVFAAEVAIISPFVRRLEEIFTSLRSLMAVYDPTMPRAFITPQWQEINDRINGRGSLSRRGSSSRHSYKDEPNYPEARSRKRGREEEGQAITVVLPLYIGRYWIVAAADLVTGNVLLCDAGHALDPADVDLVADEVLRAVSETMGQEPPRISSVRLLRPPDRVPCHHTILVACAALEMMASTPSPTADRSLASHLGLWSKFLAQGITLAIPPSFDRPSAAQSAMHTKNMPASRVLRDRIVWTVHTGTLACPFRGYW